MERRVWGGRGRIENLGLWPSLGILCVCRSPRKDAPQASPREEGVSAEAGAVFLVELTKVRNHNVNPQRFCHPLAFPCTLHLRRLDTNLAPRR